MNSHELDRGTPAAIIDRFPRMGGAVNVCPQKRISPLEIHLYYTFPEEISDTGLLDRYFLLLNEAEKKKQKRFYFSRHRHQYLVARALVRPILADYFGILPEDVHFEINDYGKPEIIQSGNYPKLRFNLSHTDGLIGLAVGLDYDIGIDVENMDRKMSLELVKRFFSPKEIHSFDTLNEDEQRLRFFEYWTLKESYVKARGMGLSIPFESFSVKRAYNGAIEMDFHDQDDLTSNWQFWLLNPSRGHKAALAFRAGTESQIKIVSKKIVPLLSEDEF